MQKVKAMLSGNDETTTGNTGAGISGSSRQYNDNTSTGGLGGSGTTPGANAINHASSGTNDDYSRGSSSTTGTGSHIGHNHGTSSSSTGGRVSESTMGTSTGTTGSHHLHQHVDGHDESKHMGLEGGPVTHDHRHLAAVTHEKTHGHVTEEVIREREQEHHHHHVQHHVQPVLDEVHTDTVHKTNVAPVTKIHESHVNTDEDKAQFAALAVHQDRREHGQTTREIIDRGEKVHETHAHHVHHVVQPVIERDVHTHETVHTVIPTHEVSHHAPIIHQSSTHEPLSMKDFVAGGGDLQSKLSHNEAGVLAAGDCDRSVDGPAETLAERLHLK